MKQSMQIFIFFRQALKIKEKSNTTSKSRSNIYCVLVEKSSNDKYKIKIYLKSCLKNGIFINHIKIKFLLFYLKKEYIQKYFTEKSSKYHLYWNFDFRQEHEYKFIIKINNLCNFIWNDQIKWISSCFKLLWSLRH